MFRDRRDAGKQLADQLRAYQDEDVLVLAVPRGGVEVGVEVAKALAADFSLLIARKLPYPDQPEAGFGAVAEDGSAVILETASQRVHPQEVQRVIEEQRQEIDRRVAVLRKGKPLPVIKDRTIILVDDGIAMGSTMRAAIKLCKKQQPARLVVAVPVAGARVKTIIADLVDRLVVLETPRLFRAVAQVYQDWYDVPDQEVLALMQTWQQRN